MTPRRPVRIALARRSALLALVPSLGAAAFAVACSATPGDEQVARGAESVSTAISYPGFPSNPSSALGAADLANLYNIPTFLPGGTIAIISNEGDDPNAEEDLGVYRGSYNLPPCTASLACLFKVTETGSTTGLPSPSVWAASHMSEALDMVSAGCPSCRIVVVEMTPGEPATSLPTAIATAKGFHAQAIVSIATWLQGYTVQPPDSTFTQPGITVFSGIAWNGLGNYPAVSPGVISVGATGANLQARPMETALNAGMDQCTTEPKPSWQHDTACAGRTANDVAAVGTAVWTFNTYSSLGGAGGWIATGPDEESVVAPSLVAAIFAQTGNGGAGPSFPYAHPSYFNDVTTGSSGTCAGILCNAGPGYDALTGMGTPNGYNMAQINRSNLDFSASDFNASQPTVGAQGMPIVTIQPGQYFIESVATFNPWATGGNITLSFAGMPFGISGGMTTESYSSDPSAGFLLNAQTNAVAGSQGTMVVSATVGSVTHSVEMEIDVVPCVPEFTSCGTLQACGTVTNNCGQVFQCATCPSGDSCSNGMCCPGSLVESNGVCCGAAQVGSDGHCCPANDVWRDSKCVPVLGPPPGHCTGTTCT